MATRTKAGRGDDARQRFEVLFRTHYARVVQYVGRRVPKSLIDDVVAATFVVAWKKFRSITDPSLPWLIRIASFEVRSAGRAARRSSSTISFDLIGEIAAPAYHEVDDTEMLAALGRLSVADREVLRLIHWDDLTRPEAADVLGVTVNTLNVRYHRALTRLEQQMPSVTTHQSPEGEPE
jgi:RNA polymerase sigma-70 factor, ECF subfamily